MVLLPLEAFFLESLISLTLGLLDLGGGLLGGFGNRLLRGRLLPAFVQVCASASLYGSRIVDDVCDEAATTAQALADRLRSFTGFVAADDVCLLVSIKPAVCPALLLGLLRCGFLGLGFWGRLLDGLLDGFSLLCPDVVTDGRNRLVEAAGLPCRGELDVTSGRGVGDVD